MSVSWKRRVEKVGLKLNIQKTKIMASGLIISWQIGGKTMETVTDFIFCGSKISADGDCSHEIKRHLLLGRKAMTNLDSIKKQRHYFANKVLSSQRYGFSSSHVWMWDLDYKEGWVPKNWCFQNMMLSLIIREMQIKITVRYHSHQSEWLRSKSLQAINAGEGVEKREPSYTVGGNAN